MILNLGCCGEESEVSAEGKFRGFDQKFNESKKKFTQD